MLLFIFVLAFYFLAHLQYILDIIIMFQKLQQSQMRLVKKINYSVSLSYLKHDFNRKRNMIIHHGLMGSSKNFKSISKNANISNYVNTYLIDCRNHGQSPHCQTHSIEDLADDLHEFIKRHNLDKNNNLTLMGHSMGGMALMKFTQKYSRMQDAINRVILIDIFCFHEKSDRTINTTGKMLSQMSKINLNQPTQTERATGKDVAGLLKQNIAITGERSHKWIPNLQTVVKQYQNINKFELLKNQWRKPVQVIYGAKSNYVNQSQIAKYCQLYPQMSQKQNFYKIDGAGHWVHFENTAQFLKTTKHILQKDN